MVAVSPKMAEIQQLRDVLLAPAATRMPKSWLKSAKAALQRHKIELHGIPSPSPSERRGLSYGAGPKQLDLVEAFQLGRYKPLPKRGGGAIAADLRSRGFTKFDLIAAGGANRSGKTVAIWGLNFALHLRDHARDGELYWAIALNFTKLREGPHKWLWDYLPRSMFMDRIYTESMGLGTNPILPLQLPDGRGRVKVVFKTEEQKLESFESDSVAGVVWTEAMREAIFDALLSRIVDTDGFIMIDYLPAEAWHDDRLKNSPEVFFRHFCMMDNAHNLPVGAIEKARRRMSKDDAAVRIDGKSRAAHGVVIREFRNEYHVEGDADSGNLVRPFKIPRSWPKWVNTDVGKYTATLLLTMAPNGRKFVADEAYLVGANYQQNAEGVLSMLRRNGLAEKDVRGGGDAPAFAMDPAAWNYSANNERHLGELYADEGLPYEPWVRTATIGEVAMLDALRLGFMQFDLLVFDRCREFRRELTTWKHKTDKDGKIDPNDRYTGDNHAIDGVKAWYSSRPMFPRDGGDSDIDDYVRRHQAELEGQYV